MSSEVIEAKLTSETSLLDLSEKKNLAARKRKGAIFKFITFIPIVLALLLILTLLVSVILDGFSWQVMTSKNSAESFPLSAARTWKQAVSLELSAQGMTKEEMTAFFEDKEALRKFKARNRVQFVYIPEGFSDASGWRWLVLNSRDKLVENFGLFEGRQHLAGLTELADNQVVFLNPWLDFSFFLRNNSGKAWIAGLSTALLGSLWVISLVILISVPLGVGTAVYLEEYAAKNWFSELLEVNLRNLAGVPSIVYGILGLYAFVRLMRLGPSVLAAALTLSLLILPVVVIAAREAIRAVPDSLRQASYGLGATKWQTVSRVILPNAITGIMTGIILAVARAIGETAPLLLVGGAGFVTSLPSGPLSSYAVMPTQIYSWIGAPQPAFDNTASAGIIALLMVLILLFIIVFYIRRRFERKW